MITERIREELFSLRDEKYRDFQGSLIPTVDNSIIIGVRTPDLKKMASKYISSDEADMFLNDLPHQYFDEYQLHAFMISLIGDFDRCAAETEKFLPYIDNWATCDQLSPKTFKKHKKELLPLVLKWTGSGLTYTKRFGIGMLMRHYLDEEFRLEYAGIVAEIRSEEYYINMMRAWYFATALAKQYEDVIPFITDNRLDVWTHNMTIRKCTESFRISPEQKEYLKTMKRKADLRPRNHDIEKA